MGGFFVWVQVFFCLVVVCFGLVVVCLVFVCFCFGFVLVFGLVCFFFPLGPNLNSRDLVLNGTTVVNDHRRRVNVQRNGLVKHLMTL